MPNCKGHSGYFELSFKIGIYLMVQCNRMHSEYRVISVYTHCNVSGISAQFPGVISRRHLLPLVKAWERTICIFRNGAILTYLNSSAVLISCLSALWRC